jgi:hypothetical protein
MHMTNPRLHRRYRPLRRRTSRRRLPLRYQHTLDLLRRKTPWLTTSNTSHRRSSLRCSQTRLIHPGWKLHMYFQFRPLSPTDRRQSLRRHSTTRLLRRHRRPRSIDWPNRKVYVGYLWLHRLRPWSDPVHHRHCSPLFQLSLVRPRTRRGFRPV